MFEFTASEVFAASSWHSGSCSMLYAVCSTGALKRGTIRPSNDDGGPMTDSEWEAYLAARLLGEVEDALESARALSATAEAGLSSEELEGLQDDIRGLQSMADRLTSKG